MRIGLMVICSLVILVSRPALGDPPPGVPLRLDVVPGMGTTTKPAGPSAQSAVYPEVDSVRVSAATVEAGVDTLVLDVFVTNPNPSALSNVAVSPTVRELIGGSEEAIPPKTVTLPANAQSTVSFAWTPGAINGGLQYSARVQLEIPYFAASEPCENRIVNGTFDGSCSGWTLVNNFPTTLGAECTFGYMKVYSSYLNTEDRRTAQAYQVVDVQGLSFPDWTVRYRARYSTTDGTFGVGVAGTAVAFYDGDLNYLGGLYQLASTAANPTDSDTQHFGRAAEGQWIYYSESLGSLLGHVPGVPAASVDYVLVAGMAYLLCSFPYCNPSSYVYVDDVEITNCARAVSITDQPFTVSSISSEVSGDYRLILEDCMESAMPGKPAYLDLVPLASTPWMWSSMKGYLCSAGVYQDIGDPVASGFAQLFAVHSMFAPALDYASVVALGLGGHVLERVAAKAVADGVMGTALAAAKDAIQTGYVGSFGKGEFSVVQGSTALMDMAESMNAVLVNQKEPVRFYALVRGNVKASVEALGATTTRDTLRHTEILVDDLIDPDLFLVAVGDSAKVLGSGAPVSPEDTVRVVVEASEADTVQIAIHIMDPDGSRRLQVFDGLILEAGGRLEFAKTWNDTAFTVLVDADGDGNVDDGSEGEVVGVDSTPPQPGLETLRRVFAAPNPFRGAVRIQAELSRPGPVVVDVLDIAGRRVRRLGGDVPAGGPVVFTWDGRNEVGAPLASGIYFVRVAAGGEQRVVKVMMAR